MKLALVMAIFLSALPVLAQSTPAALPTDAQQVQTLLQQSGCQYEVGTAAQTIANLQKQVDELQRQLKDSPRKK